MHYVFMLPLADAIHIRNVNTPFSTWRYMNGELDETAVNSSLR
jgi:hypothetical protein